MYVALLMQDETDHTLLSWVLAPVPLCMKYCHGDHVDIEIMSGHFRYSKFVY